MGKWKKISIGLVLAYVLIWYTDSIWEYIPESKPGIVSPSPKDDGGNCQIYEDSAGNVVEPCLPEFEEDPGWQGR